MPSLSASLHYPLFNIKRLSWLIESLSTNSRSHTTLIARQLYGLNLKRTDRLQENIGQTLYRLVGTINFDLERHRYSLRIRTALISTLSDFLVSSSDS